MLITMLFALWVGSPKLLCFANSDRILGLSVIFGWDDGGLGLLSRGVKVFELGKGEIFNKLVLK